MRSLPFHRLGQSAAPSAGAIDAPSPVDGEVKHTAIPDTFAGIRFQIGRMIRYVQDAASDPVVIKNVERICANDPDEMSCVQKIEAWCRSHFLYVNDPINVEFTQTPRRMVKQSRVAPDAILFVISPLLNAMSESLGPDSINGYVPPEIAIGDCDEAVSYLQGHMAARGIAPLAFDFGGQQETLHHVWGNIAGIASDLTEPDYTLGDHSRFDHYDSVEIPL